MTLSFRYKKIKGEDYHEIKSPSIPVILSGNKGKYEFIALLDSGADISVLSQEVAELLGLDLSGQREEAKGIGGKVSVVQANVNLKIKKAHESYNMVLPVKVILSNQDIESDIPILLGRAGFFDEFIVTFNQKEGRILLKKAVNQYNFL